MIKYFKFRNSFLFLFVLFLLIFVAGCKSKKTISSTRTLEKKSHNEVITDILGAELKYKTISTKGSIELKMGDSGKKATTVFKIIKDNAIQASVRPILGVEAMVITFTPDSIIILDRFNKKFVAENFKESALMANFDFNFYNLQALLTNKLFLPGQQDVTEKDYQKFSISATSDVYMLKTKDKGGLSYNFAVDASNRIASTLIYSETKNITLQWSYTDFISGNNTVYPTTMDAKADIAKKTLNVGINYSKLEIDGDVQIDKSIPKKYKQVEFLDLIGAYIKVK